MVSDAERSEARGADRASGQRPSAIASSERGVRDGIRPRPARRRLVQGHRERTSGSSASPASPERNRRLEPVDSVILDQVRHAEGRLGAPVAEAELHAAVPELGASLLPQTPSADERLVIAHELTLGHVRPDVVAAAVDLDVWHRRTAAGLAPCTAPLPLRMSLVLRSLGNQATVDELVGASGEIDRARVRGAITELVGRGWVRRADGHVELSDAYRRAVRMATAVEAKVSNWRRAVRQAQGLEGAFDGIWLAFPRSYLGNVPREPAGLRRFGLIAVESGTATSVRRPRGRRPTELSRALTEEYLFARWRSEQGSQRRGEVRRRRRAAAPEK